MSLLGGHFQEFVDCKISVEVYRGPIQMENSEGRSKWDTHSHWDWQGNIGHDLLSEWRIKNALTAAIFAPPKNATQAAGRGVAAKDSI
jgi:hypothetical protein